MYVTDVSAWQLRRLTIPGPVHTIVVDGAPVAVISVYSGHRWTGSELARGIEVVYSPGPGGHRLGTVWLSYDSPVPLVSDWGLTPPTNYGKMTS